MSTLEGYSYRCAAHRQAPKRQRGNVNPIIGRTRRPFGCPRTLVAVGIADKNIVGVAYLAYVGGFIFGAITDRVFEDFRRIVQQ